MTEHRTPHDGGQAATPASAPAAQQPAGPTEDARTAVPDPRSALQASAGDLPPPGGGRPRRARRADRPRAGSAERTRSAAPGRPRAERTPEPDGTPPAVPRPGRAAADTAAGGRPEERSPGTGAGQGRAWDRPAELGHERAAGPAAQGGPAGETRPAPAADAAEPPAGRAAQGVGARPAGGPGRPRRGETSEPETLSVPRSAAPLDGVEEDAAVRQRNADRLRYVGAATRQIARGIDLDEIVLGLCRTTVPTFADVILVYLRDPLPVGDERPVGPVVLRLRRTDRIPQERDTDGGRVPVLDPQADLPAAERCEVRLGGSLAEVLRGVRPVFAGSAAARPALHELLGEEASPGDGPAEPDTRRAILAPLRGRRRVIGAAVFLRHTTRPAFERDDLLVAAQLATHTALGVDKAVLYGREAYIADALQRSMLPETLPQPTGVRLASRYLPAAETARVGGDWYDAIPLPGSRVALVVGDVMGHSMTSAAIMGQLRTTAQTLARLDLPPQEVLHHLDEQAQRLGSDRMATCMYAVYNPVANRIVVANAGHPPPVLLYPGGRADVLRVPPGAPIGVGGVDFEAVELDAPAGSTLLLYTDGLVESRLRDVWTGIEHLRERLSATARLTGPDHPPPLEALCEDVLDMLGPGDRDDDIALLAARFEGIPSRDVANWHLEPQDQAPGRARRLARHALADWGLQELSDSVELLVSEVVTNAVRYAERPITLRMLRTDVLRCEVGDDVPQLPRLRRARPSDEGGRGLYLVNKLARRWGATRLSAGKVVWFELPTGV